MGEMTGDNSPKCRGIAACSVGYTHHARTRGLGLELGLHRACTRGLGLELELHHACTYPRSVEERRGAGV